MYSEVTTTSAASWTYAFHGNVQWLAPELLGDLQDKSPVRPTKHSDIYSFGGIMLHVCLGNFHLPMQDVELRFCIGPHQ
jgi:serine/threonine protein kinase